VSLPSASFHFPAGVNPLCASGVERQLDFPLDRCRALPEGIGQNQDCTGEKQSIEEIVYGFEAGGTGDKKGQVFKGHQKQNHYAQIGCRHLGFFIDEKGYPGDDQHDAC